MKIEDIQQLCNVFKLILKDRKNKKKLQHNITQNFEHTMWRN